MLPAAVVARVKLAEAPASVRLPPKARVVAPPPLGRGVNAAPLPIVVAPPIVPEPPKTLPLPLTETALPEASDPFTSNVPALTVVVPA